jgi:hypothetical protein
MSFLAKLEIDGEAMNVLEFHCSVVQEIDKSGKPSADPFGGNMRIIVESTKSTILFEWMTSPDQTKNGKVTFYKRDALAKMRELEFTDGYCIKYDEMFFAESNSPMQIECLISAKEIIMNGSKLSRTWTGKF